MLVWGTVDEHLVQEVFFHLLTKRTLKRAHVETNLEIIIGNTYVALTRAWCWEQPRNSRLWLEPKAQNLDLNLDFLGLVYCLLHLLRTRTFFAFHITSA